MRSARLTDDRGRPTRLCRSKQLPRHAPADVKQLVSIASHQGRASIYVNAFVLGTMLSTTLIFWFARAISLRTMLIQLAVAAAIFTIGAIRSALRPSTWGCAAAERARLACLSAGLCPACGDELIPSPPEPDSRTICPECRAAWS